MEFKLTRKNKSALLNEILKDASFFNYMFSSEVFMEFLSEIWDLKSMPSTDGRFNDAYGDIFQHIINNDDWTLTFLFSERLNILEDDKAFQIFIEYILNPKYQSEEDTIIQLAELSNNILGREGFSLIINDYNDIGLPIYMIVEKDKYDSIPDGLKINNIPFEVVKSPKGRSDRMTSHNLPKVFPSFVLAHNNGWNDYSSWTHFYLFFYKSDFESYEIGLVKIFKDEEDHTVDHLDDNFTMLDDSFCSLGQSINYYSKLKEKLGKDFLSVLFALKDAAFFPDVHDKFEKNRIFINSLIRGNEQERLLREAKHIIYGADLSKLYQFTYLFKPRFSKTSVPINFKFDKDSLVSNRVYALIGKNGTGKTQFITSLPIDLSEKERDLFIPNIPIFSKVIAVSYSPFDNFKIPKKTAEFNYVYCGLKDENGDLLTERGQVLRFHNTWKKIKSSSRFENWISLLSNFLEEEFLMELIIKDEKDEKTVNVKEFSQIRKKMSSGQSILLFIISEIVANIRFDSLLLFDEPETHLHPNAISQLMNTIYDLISQFESYCIITTHSPLIIREIFSKSVYVIEKQGDVPSVKQIEIESFGENLTTLTEVVFGNREIPKHYKKLISKLVNEGLTYEQIIALLEYDQMPLSLNASIYIKSLTFKQ